ncbi:hypothetical protein [Pseudomonas phoenicis]|uniref:hypothetical protein n=1 Tax=unclassified Pseudomonas TaxID=196821 RepID=UPI0039A3AD65
MTNKDTFGFTCFNGYLAWVVFHSGQAFCYVPQYGDWYESKYDLNGLDVNVDSARIFLERSGVHIKGDGVRMNLQPGQYYPRIWRGTLKSGLLSDSYDKLNPFAAYGSSYNQSIVAAESLMMAVKEVFRYVEPATDNSSSYSHRLRELLILLCTEIEACWSGVLKANDMELGDIHRLTTKNYIKVCTPLRLTEWKVRLKDYDLEFQPFRYWNSLQSTKSLSWYNSYNAVKHDREKNFYLSTLGNVLEAAAALHIMQVAQFGPGVYEMLRQNRFSIFHISQMPEITLSEIYLSNKVSDEKFDFPIRLAGCRI